MSGSKSGSLLASPAIPLAAVVLGAAAAPIVALALGALAARFAARGMIRLGQEVSQQTEQLLKAKIVKEEMKRQERLRKIVKKSSFSVPEIEDVAKQYPASDKLILRDSAKEEGFFHALETIQQERSRIESKRRLKPVVSTEMAEAIKAIKKEWEERKGEWEQQINGAPDRDLDPLRQEIESKTIMVQEVFPEVARDVERRLKSIKKDRRTYKRVINELDLKLKRLRENPRLYDLAETYERTWIRDPTVALLAGTNHEEGRKLLHGMDEEYQALRDGFILDPDKVERFKKMIQERLIAVKMVEGKLVFQDNVRNVKKAMKARDFDEISQVEEGGYLKIQGKKRGAPFRISHVWLRLPGDARAGIPGFFMDMEGCETYKERREENEALVRELESLGLSLRLNESLHDSKGQLIPEAVSKWFQTQFPTLRLNVVSGNHVTIDGHGTVDLFPGESDEKLKGRVDAKISPVREKERLKEV